MLKGQNNAQIWSESYQNKHHMLNVAILELGPPRWLKDFSIPFKTEPVKPFKTGLIHPVWLGQKLKTIHLEILKVNNKGVTEKKHSHEFNALVKRLSKRLATP